MPSDQIYVGTKLHNARPRTCETERANACKMGGDVGAKAGGERVSCGVAPDNVRECAEARGGRVLRWLRRADQRHEADRLQYPAPNVLTSRPIIERTALLATCSKKAQQARCSQNSMNLTIVHW